MYYTKQDKLKSLRKVCKDNGLTFKENNTYINNEKGYMIVERGSDYILTNNLTIASAFDMQENTGFISNALNDANYQY